MFLENVASKILEFLELTEDQKLEYAKRMMFYETLQAYKLKRNWKVPFEKYKKTLDGTVVIKNLFFAFITKLVTPRRKPRS